MYIYVYVPVKINKMMSIILARDRVFLLSMYVHVRICEKRHHFCGKIFFELYISREYTKSAVRNNVSCSKIMYFVLELYTEICELCKMH